MSAVGAPAGRPNNGRPFVPVEFSVTDAASGRFVPARITITDTNGVLLNFRRSNRSEAVAMRRGLFYMRGTPTTVELPPGTYNVYATRGMEWSRAERRIVVRPGAPLHVSLKIAREVDTTGFVAADTHVHTLTYSGHGDASMEERMLTLAGEGVELAVATDHNHNTDYRPVQEKMQVTEYFTPVTGNEVTTQIGHMNAFPLDPKDRPPDHRLDTWVKLADEMRAKGAKVVVLNHPRWPSLARCPFTEYGLNRLSGEFRDQPTYPFDAVELANASVLEPDPLYIVRDWFALLNRGYRVTGVGSSDTHTVGDPPGEARSYVPSRTDDPARIDVEDACARFRRGEIIVSLGIFADVWVDDFWKMGQTNALRDETVRVRLRVAAPSWVTPRMAMVFLNGREVARKPVLTRAPKQPTDARVEFRLPRPKNDAYLVCVVVGDGVNHPAWRIQEKYTQAVTNPVFLDGDGDGHYSSPHAQALATLARAGESLD
ncbi:MAG: CehA/McbA family metallohydrolase, partial [Verrucomicrobiales bacterium]|nr:CehA/McbA family metallohydrolase [Verrucomicrobiales bacterium]